MIKNRSQLLSHGFKTGRNAALAIVEHALAAVDPLTATHAHVRRQGSRLTIGRRTYDLAHYANIYVIGAGKATYKPAVAMEAILGDRITDGFIAVKDGQKGPLKKIRLGETAHPVPDERSLAAGREIRQLACKAAAGDLVFCLMSGGVSAQSVAPVSDITLADKIAVNHQMVHSGADVTEIMSVRRHLSQIKGGRLATEIAPAAMVALTVSDAVGDPMEWNTDWTSPDSSTRADAVAILKKYALWESVPQRVRYYLGTDLDTEDPAKETPKDLSHLDIYNYMTVRTRDLVAAAREKAKEMGLTPMVLTTRLEGESREVGRTLACLAREIAATGTPLAPPCALIAIGQTAVRIKGRPKGPGGANQELAAGACLSLVPEDPIAFCALDSDGTDGPTQIAGGLTDGSTVQRARERGVDFFRELMDHNAGGILKALDDAIVTGPTGTNVNDIVVGVVL